MDTETGSAKKLKNIMDQQNPRLISRCYDLYKHFQQAIIFSLIIVFQLALAGSTHTYTGVTFICITHYNVKVQAKHFRLSIKMRNSQTEIISSLIRLYIS